MKARLLRGILVASAAGLAVELVRPRGGPVSLLDWSRIGRLAGPRLGQPLPAAALERAAERYRRLAAELEAPLLSTVGGPRPGAPLPRFQALDRRGWLELNLRILRTAVEPLAGRIRPRSSRLTELGRAGTERYAAMLLGFLGHRVLGQYDPRLLDREAGGGGLYLVEPNIATWEAQARLDGDDLRRWLILHEAVHAWQFAAHPWLRDHLDQALEGLVARALAHSGGGPGRTAQPLARLPAQWQEVRRLQAVMSLLEGYSNLITGLVGRRLVTGADRIEQSHRERGGRRGGLELIFWRLTGLELKLQQYRVGEAFCQDVCDLYGLEDLNLVWKGPENLPRPGELRRPELWHRRVTAPA